MDNFLIISTPVTGPEETPAGGGRVPVPSRSIVCSLTVAETHQVVQINYRRNVAKAIGQQEHLLRGCPVSSHLEWEHKIAGIHLIPI